jgi:type IV pilus assembly protein PilA
MKSDLKVKFLQFLLGKKKDPNEGFTLIELLVVVIIIGVLAAIALPNLLGQVGKARESEAKSTIGALNRAQQGFYTEKANFTSTVTQLEVPVNTNSAVGYYTYTVPAAGLQIATGNANSANGTKDYAGGVSYNTSNLTFTTVICRSLSKDTALTSSNSMGSGTAAPGLAASGQIVTCNTTNTETIK